MRGAQPIAANVEGMRIAQRALIAHRAFGADIGSGHTPGPPLPYGEQEIEILHFVLNPGIISS